MTEASYTAWDGNLYEWPPPDGWYEAADGKWWPDGYGPSDNDDDGQDGAAPVEPSVEPVQPLAGFEAPTSIVAAGGTGSSGVSTPDERRAAESERQEYDELPNIDDVFGGVDIFADDDDEASDQDEGDRAGGHDDGTPDHVPVGLVDLEPVDRAEPEHEHEHDAADHDLVGPVDAGVDSGPDAGLASVDNLVTPAMEPVEELNETRSEVTDILAGGDAPTGLHDPAGLNGPAVADESDPPPLHNDDPLPLHDDDPAATASAGFDPSDYQADPAPFPGGMDEDRGQTVPADGFSNGLLGGEETHAAPLGVEPADNDTEMIPGTSPPDGPGGGQVDFEQRTPEYAGVSEEGAAPVPDGFGNTLLMGQEGDYDQDQDHHGGQPEGSVDAGDLESDYRAGIGHEDESAARSVWPLALAGICIAALVALLLVYLLVRGGGDPEPAVAPSDTTATGLGSINQPYDLGTDVAVYYDADGGQRRWVVKVLSPVLDGTDQLAESRQGSTPEGQVLAVSRVRLTYQSGPAPGKVTDLVFNSVGDSLAVYNDQGNGCANVEEVLPLDAELEPTEFIEGHLCWQVSAEDLAGLTLAVEAEPAEGRIHLVLN